MQNLKGHYRLNDMIPAPQKMDQHSIKETLILNPPPQKEWMERTFLQMGYPDAQPLNDMIHAKTHLLSEVVKKQVSCKFICRKEPLRTCSKTGFRTDGLTIKSRQWGKIASLLEGPKQVCGFGITLGDQVENTNQKMSAQSTLDGFIWDALCSTLTEFYADQAERWLACQYANKGMQLTRRFSPGYCDLPLLQGQAAMFRFCNLEAIGVAISTSGLMSPRKSMTGMVLAAGTVPVRLPCSFCKRHCDHRRGE